MELMRYFISMINKKKATIMLYTICHDAGALTGKLSRTFVMTSNDQKMGYNWTA